MKPTVTLYDFETKEFTEIPLAELAPGMVRAEIEGHEGVVWIDPKQIKNSERRQPPFDGTRRESVLAIQKAFPGVYEKSYEFWEDGFRRDSNPDREISIWTHIAHIYSKHSAGRSLSYRKELFALLTTCSTADPQSIHAVFASTVMTDADVGKACADYFGK